MNTRVLNAQSLTELDLIDAILAQHTIVDYGYVNKVNADKTVDITHAVKPMLLNRRELPETITRNVEVLTFAGAGFSIEWDIKSGDRMLLLGLKDYVRNAGTVVKAESQSSGIHYNRATIKAVPLCVFKTDAKATISIKDGVVKLNADGVECKANKTVKIDGNKIELNGNSKQFVTWTELNSALSQFLTQLTLAMTTTPIVGNGSPQPTWTGMPTTIDISAAKSSTVVTGG